RVCDSCGGCGRAGRRDWSTCVRPRSAVARGSGRPPPRRDGALVGRVRIARTLAPWCPDECRGGVVEHGTRGTESSRVCRMTGVVRSHGSPCFILGINAYHGDVSAVLVRDGELVVALEEERFRRIKHWAGFPTLAIQRCLAIAGISGSDISHVGVSRDPAAHFLRKALFAITKRPDLALIVDRVRNARTVRDLRQPLAVALD